MSVRDGEAALVAVQNKVIEAMVAQVDTLTAECERLAATVARVGALVRMEDAYVPMAALRDALAPR